MLIPELLLETLEDLVQDDFLKFKWFLTIEVLDGCQPIAKALLEEISRSQTVNKMMERYGGDSAVKLSIAVLRKMTFNGDAEKLELAYAERKSSSSWGASAPAVPSAPPAPAPAPAPTAAPAPAPAPAPVPAAAISAAAISPHVISADQGSIIIAPTVIGGSTDSWNVAINRN